jgi:diaminopropionate ammonia-lyase
MRYSLVVNRLADRSRAYPDESKAILGGADFDRAWTTIRAWPGYAPTPMRSLPGLAAEAGVGAIHYKDEGPRFGLKSFKALGGGYAVSRLAEGRVRGSMTVTCATDGNHGRAVAWGASAAGCRCVIFVHAGVSDARVEAIKAFGAEVRRVRGNYDDSVRQAAEVAAAEGWVVVSDTSYPGYDDVPRLVMQGYAVLAEEALAQLREPPTHVFVQGGVGGLAAAVGAHLWERLGLGRPRIVVVEPERADCLLRSAAAGEIRKVEGALDTVMAGLACGVPSLLAWAILRDVADAFVCIADEAALDTMRRLAYPVPGDPPIVGGESGVAGLAGLRIVARDGSARQQLELDGRSRVMVIGSESDTDPEFYARVIHDRPTAEA